MDKPKKFISQLLTLSLLFSGSAMAGETIEFADIFKGGDYQQDLNDGRRILAGSSTFKECEKIASKKEWKDVIQKHEGATWKPYWGQEYELAKKAFNNEDDETIDPMFLNFASQEGAIAKIDLTGTNSKLGTQQNIYVDFSFFCPSTSETRSVQFRKNQHIKIRCSEGTTLKNEVTSLTETYPVDIRKDVLKKLIEEDKENNSIPNWMETKDFEKELNKLASRSSEYFNTGYNVFRQLVKCEVIVGTTQEYKELENEEFQQKEEKVSFDEKIKCKSEGVETQDYPQCKKMVTAYDAIFAGRKVIDAAQSLKYQDDMMDAQMDMQKNMAEDSTAGLKYQKDAVESQAKMLNQKAAVEGVALGVMMKYYSDMPDSDALVSTATTGQTKTITEANYAQLVESYEMYTNSLAKALEPFHKKGLIYFSESETTETQRINGKRVQIDMEDSVIPLALYAGKGKGSSGLAVGVIETTYENEVNDYISGGTHALLQNQAAKQKMKAAMVQAGIDVAKYMAQSNLMDKQAGRIQDAINSVEEFQPEDIAYDQQDVLTTECTINPSAPKCRSSQLETEQGYYDGGINITGFQGGTAAESGNNNLDDASNAVGDGDGGPLNNTTTPGLGGIDTNVAKSNGLIDGKLGAATSKKGEGGSGGGGGGGGSAPSGAAPSGGGGGGGGQQAIPGGSSGGKKFAYSGGGNSLSFSSGSRRKASKKKAKNPFASLFGKGKKPRGGVLNYRGLASKEIGNKRGSLFQMISSRYDNISKEKRLMEYKLK